jgi:predicted dehydrogenase
VLLALPIHLTAPITLEAARAGKHVLLEKPLGSNLEQARQLKEQLAHLPITALVAENFRYMPKIKQAQQMLREGRIGELILLRLHSVARATTHDPQDFSSTPWRHDIQYRGGPILDGGVHHAAALRELGGDIEWVQAFTKYGGSELGGTTTISMNLRFRSGALGNYLYSSVCHDEQSSFLGLTLYGSTGTIEVHEGELRLLRPDQPTETITIDDANGGYYGEFLNFYAALRENQPVIATVEQSYRDMELILRGLDSAEQAQVVLL